MTKKINYIPGDKYGRCTILKDLWVKKWHTHVQVQCDCGKIFECFGVNLRNWYTNSCGCYRNEKIKEANFIHGDIKTKEYSIYHGMKKRCYNANCKAYKHYGWRWINICDRWLESFENFLEDMGRCPDKMSIDRIDTNWNYEPSNCKWSTSKEQNNNRRNNVKLKNTEQ